MSEAVLTADVPDTLTPRQRDVYRWMAAYLLREGRMPTVREIQLAIGLRSPTGALGHLRAIQHKGLLAGVNEADARRNGPAVARGVRFTGLKLVPAFEEGEAGERARALWKEIG